MVPQHKTNSANPVGRVEKIDNQFNSFNKQYGNQVQQKNIDKVRFADFFYLVDYIHCHK